MKIQIKKNGKRNSRTKRRGAKYWVVAVSTMGVLVAYTVGNSRAVSVAYAQDARVTAGAIYSEEQEQSQTRRFDIPPGTLETVLNAFQSLTGLTVQIPDDKIRNISSPGVSGVYTAELALKKLLHGTGIVYRFTSPEIVTLEVGGLAEAVEVEEGATELSSPKYTEPLRNTPQTITVIPKEVIAEQGATTLRDVLRNVSGLTITAGEGGAPAGDNLTLRGFSARNDIFVDGVRDLGPQSRDPFNLEQVEIVKGPGSAFTGRGSTGGTINLVSKSPSVRQSFGGTLQFGTDGTKRVTADINLPLERIGLGEHTAFRLNLLGHESGVAGRDVVENERWGVAPSLALGLGTPTRLTFSYFKLKQNNISDYGIPWVPVTNNVLLAYRDKPAPVPRNTFYGLKNRDFEKLNADLVTVKFERDFNEKLSLRNQLRYGRSTRDSIATPPRFTANVNSIVINRELRSWMTEDEIWDNQSDLRANFSTGEIEHTLVGGLALTRENNLRTTRTAGTMPTTLFNPNPNDVFTGDIIVNPIVGDITANSAALYVFDTAKLNDKWEVSGGLRWDYFDAEGIVTITGAPVSRIDRLLSFRAGVVYKPLSNGSIYAAYGTSLNPSLEGLSYGTASATLDPEKTYNFEVGSKWDLLNDRLSLNGAVFHIRKSNARTPGLPGEPPVVLDGEQRVAGVEIGATGNITREWSMLAAYTFLDSKVVKSNTATEIGKELINTPRNSFNMWSTYRLWKLQTGGGARYVGRRFGNTTNTRVVDSYWLVEGMASYPLTEKIDLRLNLYNLTNRYYFEQIGGGHLVPGPGRSASLSASFSF